ncbi:MAG TPA: DNA-directed RNA polymerase subunit omega [Verrucomicrobiae bacterium]|nr:DNA-directed RNA polymerase subunit omega [Verrucomicrobiae bacterium]
MSLRAADQPAQTLVAESNIMLEMEPESLTVSPAVKGPVRTKISYLEPALLRIPGPELLINVVRRRVRQLIQGHRPLTQINAQMGFADIALKEISEGKLFYELDAAEIAAAPDAIQQREGVTEARY